MKKKDTKKKREYTMLADGFEKAVVGLCQRCGEMPLVVYDYDKCVKILMKDGIDYDEATKHMEFNVTGAWVGKGTPLFLHRMGHNEVLNYLEGQV